MNRRVWTVFVLSILFIFPLSAQKLIKLTDPFVNPEVYPEYMRGLQWKGKTNSYTYVKNNTLIQAEAKGKKTEEILSLEELNKALESLKLKELRRFPSITWIANEQFTFKRSQKLVSYNVKSKKAETLNSYPEEAENLEFGPDHASIAYTIDNNLFVNVKGKQTQITTDKKEGIVNGQTVHRVEFGIEKGIFWSPKGNAIAFYRKDETMVKNYPLVDIDPRMAELKNEKYPMAGMKSHHVTLGVYDMQSGKTVFMKTGEPKDQYLTAVSWDPSGQYVFIAILNRDQNHLKLKKYDVKSGEEVKVLFEEKDPKYVEPEHPMYFCDARPGEFLWFSERDGFNHLYLYKTDGSLVKQITKGNWLVTSLLGFSPDGKNIFIQATKESPIEDHAYKVEISSGKMTKLTGEHGQHSVDVAHNGAYILDNFSNSKNIINRYEVRETKKGTMVKLILDSKNPFENYNMGQMEISTLKAKNGDDLYYRLIKPIDFDPNKKYPVFVYVYGGPHAQLVTDSWLGGAGYFLNYMAQQGYVVFTLDNHGSANRGKEFEQSVFRNLGTLEIEDQMIGIDYLKTLPYVDADRIGVNGWSYGGFMTTSLLLRNPGVFKVGVAGGPVIDWKYYEVMYGERYMDTPENNEEGYKTADLKKYVDNLGDARLMIVHGTMDPTVVWQHSLSFVKACVDEGVLIDYFVYPGHEHNVRGMDRVHLWKKIEQYFGDHL